MTEHQQDKIKENIPARPQKLELKLLEKKSHISTDIVSFKFARRSEDVNQKQRDHDYSLNYKAGQYAVVDLGTKEDPEGPIRSFTLAKSYDTGASAAARTVLKLSIPRGYHLLELWRGCDCCQVYRCYDSCNYQYLYLH